MTGPLLIRDLGLIVISAALFALAARAVRAPSIVAYMLAGLVLGPVAGLIAVGETVELISEVGIALLLFLVGLELSFEKIRDLGRVALLAGLGQVAFTAAGGAALALALGLDGMQAAFLAAALAFSSTVVAVKLLGERRELDSLHGRIAIGVLLVQDVLVIVALTLAAALGGGDELALGVALRRTLVAFAGMGGLLAAALLAARRLLPPLFRWAASSLETTFVWSLGWCFLFIVAAEAFHLSVELGAFVAGVSLAQLPHHGELSRRVHPITNFFLAVFFVSLGTRMDLFQAAAYWKEAALLSAFVLLGKPLVLGWLVRGLGFDRRTGFRVGTTLGQISEFSFILIALGLSAGLVGTPVLSIVTLVGLATITVSAYAISYGERSVRAAERLGVLTLLAGPGDAAGARAGESREETGPEGHVVVVGMNRLGRRLIDALAERGERVLAIDTDARKLEGLPAETLMGNVDDLAVLEEAGIERAKLVISALQIEAVNGLLAYRCRELGVPCSLHAFDSSLVREFEEVGADHLIVSKDAGLREIAAHLRRRGLIGA